MAFDFSMPAGWDSGGASPGGLYGIGSGLGDGYDWASVYSSAPPSETSQSMQDLQSGGSLFDWTSAFHDTLGAVVSWHAIDKGLPTGATNGYYKASDGKVYPMGYGASMGMPTGGNNALLMWLLLIGAVVLIAKEV